MHCSALLAACCASLMTCYTLQSDYPCLPAARVQLVAYSPAMQITMGVNYFSLVYVTLLLLPVLKSSHPSAPTSRIVFVTSLGRYAGSCLLSMYMSTDAA